MIEYPHCRHCIREAIGHTPTHESPCEWPECTTGRTPIEVLDVFDVVADASAIVVSDPSAIDTRRVAPTGEDDGS